MRRGLRIGRRFSERSASWGLAAEQLERSPQILSNFNALRWPFFHFLDRASWLALALETPFWRVTGTMVGTATHHDLNGSHFVRRLQTVVVPKSSSEAVQ